MEICEQENNINMTQLSKIIPGTKCCLAICFVNVKFQSSAMYGGKKQQEMTVFERTTACRERKKKNAHLDQSHTPVLIAGWKSVCHFVQ